MNRKLILAAAFLGFSGPILAPVATLHAQETAATPQARTPDQVVNTYATRLSLTEDQKTKLKPIIADRQQKMLDLRADTSVQGRDKMKKMRAIMDDTDTRMKAVLTGDQFTKYKAMEAEQREKMKERRQGTGANAN